MSQSSLSFQWYYYIGNIRERRKKGSIKRIVAASLTAIFFSRQDHKTNFGAHYYFLESQIQAVSTSGVAVSVFQKLLQPYVPFHVLFQNLAPPSSPRLKSCTPLCDYLCEPTSKKSTLFPPDSHLGFHPWNSDIILGGNLDHMKKNQSPWHQLLAELPVPTCQPCEGTILGTELLG